MNTKPKIFIGSSSEGLQCAQVLHAHLERDYRPYIWTHGLFTAGNYALEDLERAIREHDFAVICGTPDDPLVKREQQLQSMRDNVIFELGLFMGALTRRRTLLLVPRRRDLAIPSDLYGLTRVEYDGERFAEGGREQIAALQSACLELARVITSVWSEVRRVGEVSHRSETAKARLRAVRRIYGVIVELRDVLVALPGKAIESLGQRDRFDDVKTTTAQTVARLATSLDADVALANVTKEYKSLVEATRETVLTLPYPSEFLVTEDTLKDVVVQRAKGVIAKLGTSDSPIALIESAIQDELETRATSLATRYSTWWSRSQNALRAATTALHDALLRASLDAGEYATSDPLELGQKAHA